MSQLGMGVMLGMLAGNQRSVDTFTEAMNKTITSLLLTENDALRFEFDDGSKMELFDDGQYCCENRYMRTDDDLDYYVGSKLLSAETKEGPSEDDQWGEPHDVEFLEVETSKGVFTMASHNEHNGHYGGFSIRARAIA